MYYERVSKYNRLVATIKLPKVVFLLTETALLWFDKHEDKLTSWHSFVDKVKEFRRFYLKEEKGGADPCTESASSGETYTTHIEDVQKIFSLANSSMSDEDKVGHLLKGIAEDVCSFLITK